MMQNIHRLLEVQAFLFFIIMMAMLCLQVAALRRHGKPCFRWLVASTLFSIGPAICTVALLYWPLTETLYAWCYSLAFAFGLTQGLLGLRGAMLLFRDYRQLAERCANLPDSDTHPSGSHHPPDASP